MKTLLVLVGFFIFQSCEFGNEQQANTRLDGSYAYITDSSKTIWEFKGGQEFLERLTYKCDTVEMKADFELVDTTLTLQNVQVRMPKASACPMEFTPWDGVGGMEYKVKASKDKLLVLKCKVGRCREPTVWIEFIRI
jgi:hypothetical protein